MVINLWDIYLLNENNIDNTFLYVKLEAISESVVLFICNEIKVLHNNRFVMLAQKKSLVDTVLVLKAWSYSFELSSLLILNI